ncbi:MAG: alpha-glucan family phosphorylase, partial [Ornithinibacter sp.]
DRLYGGNTEHRLRQEMLLGIGGVRAIRAFTRITGATAPEVFHTNEGHAGFLGLERIRELTEDTGLTFEAALEVSRAGTVFTTHTPVPAGIDRFPRDLVAQYFGGDNSCAGLPVERILALGSEDFDGGDPAMFNMAVMGFRLAQRANGVSKLHGVVSRGMFGGLWPGFDADERPITSITNGVHAPTWVAREIFDLARSHGVRPGPDPDADHPHLVFDVVDKVPGKEIWDTKRLLRQRLVDDARARIRKSWHQRGASTAELKWIDSCLDPNVLTIGFARRVPSYKRLTLMLRDPARLKRLLLDPERPVQLVIAGKSHPADEGGKKLIQEMVRFADDPEVRHRIVFLPNYDIAMAQPLYPGCDVWLNNPLRPFEACGTSGMKAALNGALNLSILDGWWDEWFDGKNGWAIPTADGVEDPERRDDIEARALYQLVERQVAPRFYDTDENGLPQNWLAMMLHTVTTLGPKVRASRMVRDYTEKLYVPAARSGWSLREGDYAGARDLATYKAKARSAWREVHVDHVESSGVGDSPELGETLHVTSYVSLGDLTPDDVEVQVVHGRTNHHGDELHDVASVPLEHLESYEHGRHQFAGDLVLRRSGAFGYTVRVLPKHDGLARPSELGLVANA